MYRSDYWPVPSAHRLYWERRNNPYVYEYDPTDDGPEVEVILAIRIGSFSHPYIRFGKATGR